MRHKNEYRRWEGVVRGFSNHRRMQMLELLSETPKLDVNVIARRFNINYKTCSHHLRRLAAAGLVGRQARGASVEHELTSRGRLVLGFLDQLD